MNFKDKTKVENLKPIVILYKLGSNFFLGCLPVFNKAAIHIPNGSVIKKTSPGPEYQAWQQLFQNFGSEIDEEEGVEKGSQRRWKSMFL